MFQTSGLPVLMRQMAEEIAGRYVVTYETDAPRAKIGVDTPRKGVKLRAPSRAGN